MSDDDQVVFKRRSKNTNRKRKHFQDGQDEDEKVYSASDILKTKKQGKQIKVQDSTTTASTTTTRNAEMSALGVAFKSSGTASTLFDSAATRTIDIDGLHDTDPLAAKVLSGEAAEKMDGLYQGQSKYKEFVNKRQEKITQSNAGGLRAGPLKGLSGVRISSRFDYAPAICKDYKETGYCGFGDSCVFMHDRGDYKMGWQLDKEWEEQQKQAAEENDPNKYFLDGLQEDGDQVGNEADSDDDLPFACLICRKDFKNPVVTRCKHYFCESCALKQFSKSPACFACNANTAGVFNVAKEFKIKLEEKRRRMEARAKEIADSHAAIDQQDQDGEVDAEDDDHDHDEIDDDKS